MTSADPCLTGGSKNEPSPANPPRHLLCLLTVFFSGLSAAWVVIPRLFREWQRNPATDHIPIVLGLAVLLWWKSHPTPATSPTQEPATHLPAGPSEAEASKGGSRLSGALLAFSVACLGADALLEEEFLLAFGLWSGIGGIIRLSFSPLVWKRAGFSLILLLFCLPLPPYVAFHYLHFPLQQLSTVWTTGMLDLLGREAVSVGTVIQIGSRSLQVVEECSGVRFLTALSITALLAGYLRLRTSLSMRMLLFGAAIPLAILTNILRLTVAGEILVRRGPEAAQTFIHSEAVAVFYLAGIVLLLLFSRLLEGLSEPIPGESAAEERTVGSPASDTNPTRSSLPEKQNPNGPDLLRPNHPAIRLPCIITTIWFLTILTGSILATRQPPPHLLRPGLNTLQLTPAGWNLSPAGAPLPPQTHTPSLLQAVQHRRQRLIAPDGRLVDLEIAWWPGRRPRNRLIVFHQSVLCSMGLYADAVHEESPFGEGFIGHSRFQTPAGPVSLWYWLQSEDRISTRPYSHVVWQYLREIRGLSVDGCFVLIAVQDTGRTEMNPELTGLANHLRATLQDWFKTVPLTAGTP